MRIIFTAFFLTFFAGLSRSQDLSMLTDSVPAKKTSFFIKSGSFVAPSALFGLGLLANNSQRLQEVNLKIRERVLRDNGRFSSMKIDDALQYVPAEAVFALNALGLKSENGFVDRALLYGLSHYISKTTVDNLKGITNRLRPDGSDRRSFPSGHTATAFAAAEFMRLEYRDASPVYFISAYTVAATTGALRVHHNKHWFTDVLAGAGVGILSTNLAYTVYPRLKQLAGRTLKLKSSNFKLGPSYLYNKPGFALSYTPR